MFLCEELSDREGEDTTFCRNVGIRSPNSVASYRKRAESSRVYFFDAIFICILFNDFARSLGSCKVD